VVKSKRTADLALDSSEERALAVAIDAIRKEWGFAPSWGLEDLICRWRSAVEEIEAGYKSHVESYINALDMRELLDQVAAVVPERLASELRSRTADLDSRFLFATEGRANPVEEPDPGAPLHSRWYRVPKRFDSDLRETGWFEALQHE
jgi:hypothetical protein